MYASSCRMQLPEAITHFFKSRCLEVDVQQKNIHLKSHVLGSSSL